jgi:hypothetical protein
MGKIRSRHPVKLITGFIFQDTGSCLKALRLLGKRFGRIDFESQDMPFRHTDYYANEFGAGLKKKIVSFEKLVALESLAEIKIFTNAIEARLAVGGLRSVNIDPGYLDLAKLVLASTKDYRHRIYLKKGIYAEVTLFFQDRGFRPWEWTYPDYKTAEYLGIFNRIREIYARQTKK